MNIMKFETPIRSQKIQHSIIIDNNPKHTSMPSTDNISSIHMNGNSEISYEFSILGKYQENNRVDKSRKR